jgi:hypothetical protein
VNGTPALCHFRSSSGWSQRQAEIQDIGAKFLSPRDLLRESALRSFESHRMRLEAKKWSPTPQGVSEGRTGRDVDSPLTRARPSRSRIRCVMVPSAAAACAISRQGAGSTGRGSNGREDVYARRWENDDGRHGYMPAVNKDWKAINRSRPEDRKKIDQETRKFLVD